MSWSNSSLSIAKREEKSYQSQQLLNKEINQISVNNKSKNESLTANLVDLIYRRFNIIKKRLEYICNFENRLIFPKSLGLSRRYVGYNKY